MRQAKRFILAWTAREMTLIEHVKRNFLAGVDGLECSFWCTGLSETATQTESLSKDGPKADEILTISTPTAITSGRMDIRTVLRSFLETGHHTTVLVCGPSGMADEATKEVVTCVKDGFTVDLIEEAYAW